MLYGCARPGSPEGGPYDTTPPRLIKCLPANGTVRFEGNKVKIYFDENVRVEKSNEKVIFAPPQMAPPRILSGHGKNIIVIYEDSLRSNTTYTIDFTDAIVDLNEGNPLEGFTYAFSTGEVIDSMEIRGKVYDAWGLYPIPGIYVGVHRDSIDSLFEKTPFLRMGRTLSDGSFTIANLPEGSYRLFALNDIDKDYRYSQRTEGFAFSPTWVKAVPPLPPVDSTARTDSLSSTDTLSLPPDSLLTLLPRQDTLPKRDSFATANSLSAKTVSEEQPTVLLRYSVNAPKKQYLKKSVRKDSLSLTLSFALPVDPIPQLTLQADSLKPLAQYFWGAMDATAQEITYWMVDSALYKRDTLALVVHYPTLDSLEHTTLKADSIRLLYNRTTAQGGKKATPRPKAISVGTQKNQVPQDSVATDAIQPDKRALKVDLLEHKTVWAKTVRDTLELSTQEPVLHIDTTRIRLLALPDSLAQKDSLTVGEALPIVLQRSPRNACNLQLLCNYQIGMRYRLQLDSAALRSAYGSVSDSLSFSFRTLTEDQLGSLHIQWDSLTISHPTYLQLVTEENQTVLQQQLLADSITLYHLPPGSYYARLWVDANNNGLWDPARYPLQQPEEAYLYPQAVAIQAKFTNKITWAPYATPLYKQRPQGLKLDEEGAKYKAPNTEKQKRIDLNEEYVKRMRTRYGEDWDPSDSDRKLLGLPSRATEKAERKAKKEAEAERIKRLPK